jgi:hypothetical protein
MLTLTNENPATIKIDLTSALEILGKTPVDLTDVIFIVKNKPTDDDSLAILNKKLSVTGEITLSGDFFYVNILPADYSDFEIGKSYKIGIGIKYTGLTKFLEVNIAADESTISVKQDTIRD